MADQNDMIHPGRDPELLERYALGRLPASELSAFEDHCRGCAECRQLLEEELRVAAGVRRMAHDRMKAKLAKRLSAAGNPEIPWPRIAAVAATVLIVAGVSIIGIWLQKHESGQISLPPAPSPAPSYTTNLGENRETPAHPQTGGDRRPSDGARGTTGMGTAHEKKDLARADNATGAARIQEKDQTVEPTKDSRLEREAVAAPTASARGEEGKHFWTEGIVSRESLAGDAGAIRDEITKNRPGVADMQTNAVRKAPMASTVQIPQVVLSQEPARLMKAQEEGVQAQARKNGVPTLARQIGDQLILTLYPDTLFPPGDLQRATVRRKGHDSLLIQVGNQLIRYRLPSSLLELHPAR